MDALRCLMNGINTIGFNDASAFRTVQVLNTRMRTDD